MSVSQVVALLVASLVVMVVFAVILLLNFMRPGPPGPTGAPGAAGPDATPAAYKNLLLDTPYQVDARAYVCTYPTRSFYIVHPFERTVNPTVNGYNMAFSEPFGTSSAVSNVLTLFSNYVRDTSVFAVTNASSKPLYLNLIGFSDPAGLPYLYEEFDLALPSGGTCRTEPSASPPRYSAYFIPAGESRLFTSVKGGKLTILTF